MIRAVRRFEERLHRAFHYGYGARTSLRTSVRRLDDRFTEAGVSKDSIRWLVRYVTQHEVETHSSGRTVYFPNADSLASLIADMEEWIDCVGAARALQRRAASRSTRVSQ